MRFGRTEKWFGRYDVMMIPKIKETKKYPAIIMEFKVRNIKREEIHHYGLHLKEKSIDKDKKKKVKLTIAYLKLFHIAVLTLSVYRLM